jgi:CRP-like cAMP-binding protein
MLSAPQRLDIVEKLQSRLRLSDEQARRIAGAIGRVETVPARTDLGQLFGAIAGPVFLIEGYAYLYKMGSHGGRQILAFHLPGEMINSGSAILPDTHWGIATLSQCEIARIEPAAVHEMVAADPMIGDALWVDGLVNTEIALEWVMNLGRREAPARVAHLFCELAARMEAIGRCPEHSFVFPASQVDLADASGITHVHLNRVLRRLRAEGMLSLHGHHIVIHDWDRLCDLADFDPAYLHLGGRALSGPAGVSARGRPPGQRPAPDRTGPAGTGG